MPSLHHAPGSNWSLQYVHVVFKGCIVFGMRIMTVRIVLLNKVPTISLQIPHQLLKTHSIEWVLLIEIAIESRPPLARLMSVLNHELAVPYTLTMIRYDLRLAYFSATLKRAGKPSEDGAMYLEMTSASLRAGMCGIWLLQLSGSSGTIFAVVRLLERMVVLGIFQRKATGWTGRYGEKIKVKKKK